MHRIIAVLIVSFALLSVARSDQPLRCYMCTSKTHKGCETDPKAHNIEPIECTLNHMSEMQHIIQTHNLLSQISDIFAVDNAQHYQSAAPMACAKMTIKVDNEDVTVRNCQTAKTETIDPCKAIQGKFTSDHFSLENCELCMRDACNSSTSISPKFFFTLLLVLGTVALGALYSGA